MISKPKPKIFKSISISVAVIGVFIGSIITVVYLVIDFIDDLMRGGFPWKGYDVLIHPYVILFLVILISISVVSLLVSWLRGEKPSTKES